MNIEKELTARSGSACELCAATNDLQPYAVKPGHRDGLDGLVHVCGTCLVQIEDPEQTEVNHWRCLNESMWSEVPAVKVVAWRMLDRLRSHGWPVDLLDMLFLDEETLSWAKAANESAEQEGPLIHMDSNGNVLEAGDNVILIQNLNVKGANFIAKRGTAIRKISLVSDNPEQIEGRVNGQEIVILTKFVKKSN